MFFKPSPHWILMASLTAALFNMQVQLIMAAISGSLLCVLLRKPLATAVKAVLFVQPAGWCVAVCDPPTSLKKTNFSSCSNVEQLWSQGLRLKAFGRRKIICRYWNIDLWHAEARCHVPRRAAECRRSLSWSTEPGNSSLPSSRTS